MASERVGVGGLNVSKDEATSGAFDLFSSAVIDTSIVDSTVITVRPINSATSAGPFEFVIPADGQKWTACETLRLSGRVKIAKKTTAEGTDTYSNLAETDNVSVCNNFYHSLFKSVSIKLNGTALNDPSGMYKIVVFISFLLI